MRRSFEDIMEGISAKSKAEIKASRRKRSAVIGGVSAVLAVALCLGLIFNPFSGTGGTVSQVLDNGSSEEPSFDKEGGGYLPLSMLSTNLMAGVTPVSAEKQAVDALFLSNYADFGIELFKDAHANGDNAMVSPLSVVYALAMLNNGAKGETKAQIEEALGGMDADTLNKYMHYLTAYLQEGGEQLKVANSMWIKDSEDFYVVPEFLQTNANYYDTDLYKARFDAQTVDEVNAWVKEKTDGMIDRIVDSYPPRIVMQLINALCFDAEWQNTAESSDVEMPFSNANGTESNAKYMKFDADRKYIETSNATGMIKDYKGGKYSFVALMPNEGVTLDEYIATLSGESFMQSISSAKDSDLIVWMPEFESETSIDLIPTLRELGITDVFDKNKSNLSGVGKSASGNIYVSSASQKTFIEVSELGTRAAAVTDMKLDITSLFEGYYLELNRPFVYAIIDTATGMPVFMGAVTKL